MDVGPKKRLATGRRIVLCSATQMSSKKAPEGEALIRDFIVTNQMGIHARPAAMFVKLATQFTSDIFVEKDGEKVNGKSIMGLMMLAAGPGCTLTVQANGGDAAQALAAIESLINRKFDES
jgi:phosphocarrier protein